MFYFYVVIYEKYYYIISGIFGITGISVDKLSGIFGISLDKLLIIDYDKYIEFFNEKEHIKIDRCQICDSTEICGEKNINDEIILYCYECNPYI